MANTGDNSKAALVEALNGALADHLALYLKTKNFHWHVSGPRFRSLHLMFDEQAGELFGLVDTIAERVRKIGEKTLTGLGSVSKATNIADQDDINLAPEKMIEELRDDNVKLLERLKTVKQTSEDAGDNATNGMVDDWIDQTEERIWFLSETIN
ncbi:starvation-inducible DNA-binding protein [Altererythrobacter atlanticus]|uniref:DNA protection during starvation protein n=1 Tax=Croceibacterium atlanticum TaxID=1267766 RepID=A0A0F7KXR6_9SPHN|nr:DNA starvation/stationary phase protection protein [Croceibacterium atlanticum]AKH44031.1 DNA protection during starvation protein [Croceibacterium atlanticum]MBB5732338.1 starvation-inducible DNA-binding protein [Croceibacterium atlanticum]